MSVALGAIEGGPQSAEAQVGTGTDIFAESANNESCGGRESRPAESPLTDRAKHTDGSTESRLQSVAGVAPGPHDTHSETHHGAVPEEKNHPPQDAPPAIMPSRSVWHTITAAREAHHAAIEAAKEAKREARRREREAAVALNKRVDEDKLDIPPFLRRDSTRVVA